MSNLKRSWALAHSLNPLKLTPEKISEIASVGIHDLEISCSKLAPWFDDMDYLHNAKRLSEALRPADIAITSIHLPFSPSAVLDPSNPDRCKRIATIRTQASIIKAAADAGIPIAVIHPSNEPYAEEDREERLKCSIDTIASLCEIANENRMTLALENLPRTCLCRTSDEMKLYLDAIPDLRVCFDTNHSLTEKNADYIKAIGDKIVTLHVSDYDFIDERHLLPTDGLIDWKEIVETLDSVGYSGRFLYETSKFETYADLRANYEYLMNL